MSNEKETKKQKLAEVTDDAIENVNGGYGIIHRHDGYKQLVGDDGTLVDKKFINTYVANDYAKKQGRNFRNGKEWEVY